MVFRTGKSSGKPLLLPVLKKPSPGPPTPASGPPKPPPGPPKPKKQSKHPKRKKKKRRKELKKSAMFTKKKEVSKNLMRKTLMKFFIMMENQQF